jgi:hypothetical protein
MSSTKETNKVLADIGGDEDVDEFKSCDGEQEDG